MSLVVIYYRLKPVKISYANGGCDCVNHRILHPVQGLESGRGGGEVRVMTHIRV
jgi:hypothetical protein